MYILSRHIWNKTHGDFKGKWCNANEPEWIGKLTWMPPLKLTEGRTELWIEDVHFKLGY